MIIDEFTKRGEAVAKMKGWLANMPQFDVGDTITRIISRKAITDRAKGVVKVLSPVNSNSAWKALVEWDNGTTGWVNTMDFMKVTEPKNVSLPTRTQTQNDRWEVCVIQTNSRFPHDAAEQAEGWEPYAVLQGSRLTAYTHYFKRKVV